MGAHTGGQHYRLRGALQDVRDPCPDTLAVLVTETGALECVERRGDVLFIDRIVTIEEEGVSRTFTYHYLRTDLCAQGGYRVYVLNEINSGDCPNHGAGRVCAREPTPARTANVHTRRGELRPELSRLSDEAGNDEP